MALSVDPPQRGKESDECVDLYEQEKNEIFNGLKDRAGLLTQTFNEMEGISCTEVQGAMYAFPQLHLPQKFIEHAKKEGKKPDFLYCMEMLDKTGVMTVPGSGFGQKEGTHHLRITNLVSPTSTME